MRKNINIIYSIAFCLIIFTPPIVSIYEHISLDHEVKKSTLKNEKRELTPWPHREIFEQRITDYTAQINSYFEDRFLFREELLSIAIRSKHSLLRMKSNGQGLIGSNNWLFLRRALESGLKFKKRPQQSLTQWADNALQIKKRVEQSGGVFLIMTPPDKAQLYPEHVPQGIAFTRDTRLIDELKPLLKQRQVTTVDLLDHLLDYKNKSPSTLLYSKTDTHWTHQGALRGYQKVVSELNTKGVELAAVDLPHLRTIERKQFSGDIAGLMGLSNTFTEPLETLRPKHPYNVLATNKTLLIYGDSFSGRLRDFWKYSFKETHCYHHNIIKPNLDLIELINPDVVILQIVERNLNFPLLIDQNKTRTCL